MDDELRQTHRNFGVSLFNDVWDLIDKSDRTADEDTAMLLGAATSRWHWGEIGGPEEIATGDWQVAHVASLLGLADVAKQFAERNLVIAITEGWDGWRLASAQEGMARAFAAAGDVEGRERHLKLAREALAREPSDEEREVIAEQIDSVPEVAQF